MSQRSWRNSLEFIFYRAWAEFRSEATRSYLGFIWWFLEPLIYMAAFYLVFASGLRGRGPEYAPFLLCALVGWKWFSSSVLRTARWAQANGAILQEVYAPKWLFVAISIVINFYKFVIVFVLLLVLLLIAGIEPTWYWFGSLGIIVVEALFLVGFASLVAAIVPFVPDTRILLDNLMLVLFFLSGIFFDLSEMSPVAQQYLQWNPLIHIFDGYRDLLLAGRIPDLQALGIVAAIGLLFLGAGMFLLTRFDRRYPRVAK